jgi:hypothetical protein
LNKLLRNPISKHRFIYEKIKIPLDIHRQARSFSTDGTEVVLFSVKLTGNPPDSFSTACSETFVQRGIYTSLHAKRVYFIQATLDVAR